MTIMHHIARLCLTILFVLSVTVSYAQQTISFCSWNLQHFGKSKHDTTIVFIADILKDFDVIALQEVVAGPGGAQAVARLHDALGRKGAKWDYAVSDPTTGGAGKERYAFLWKTARLKIKGRAFPERFYEEEIDREPYLVTLEDKNGKTVTFVNFHAVPKNKQPEREIKYFKCLPEMYPGSNLIFAGDFNCPQSHTVFNPLKRMGYKPVLTGQKTTLKQQCIAGDCLASEYDNVFYHQEKIQVIRAGIIPFYQQFSSVKDARKLSDHLPVYVHFHLK